MKKNVWWWRRQAVRRYGVPGVRWDKLTKEAARNYELMRRSSGGKKIKKSYPELNSHERQLVHSLWCNWKAEPTRFAMDKRNYNQKGWTQVLENPPVQWNLRLADTVLLAEFKIQLARERRRQRIRARNPMKENTHRAASWKYIEYLDRRFFGIPVFTEGERRMRRNAKPVSARYLRQFNKALAVALEEFRQNYDVIPLKAFSPAQASGVMSEPFDENTETKEVLEFFSFGIVLNAAEELGAVFE